VVRALRDFEPTSLPIHAVYPSRRLVPTKVRVMIEFLASEFGLDPLLSDRGFGHPALSNSRTLARRGSFAPSSIGLHRTGRSGPLVLREQGILDSAEAAYRESVAMNGNSAEPHLLLGLVLHMQRPSAR
jgi:hypothetical protein